MDFVTLHEMIPRATGDKLHVMEMKPYPNITLAMPGRHQNDTDPVGGDFVVMVDSKSKGWVKHQFTHGDLWHDLEYKFETDPTGAKFLMVDYAKVVRGEDPNARGWDFQRGGFDGEVEDPWAKSLHPQTFLYAVQCLAVAEHRRYWKHERDGGGRYLPARFSVGIVEGKWTAKDAEAFQYRGRQGLENLIKEKGRPTSLKKFAEG
ncbi:hypothetical protein SEA_EMMA1919_199 [Streptomyces phage Emma1919]|uniref:Uncharacterized protein n=1 Tax=Streptomyces phage Gilson TaxID=2488789 RepID=A0A3T0ICV9_9CAUD|nr:hypothetical protein HWB98_gp086 [Streptomyces phage Gilson]AZU97243.1 hypothetical protein SEA_GILSON_198 [Streptomyces phage Gilson]URQ04780.1 hypothetical protein SEA_EMMA1919_199 [Streptomyces phage Emma1919]